MYKMVDQKWSEVKEEDRPSRLLAILDSCRMFFYPNIVNSV